VQREGLRSARRAPHLGAALRITYRVRVRTFEHVVFDLDGTLVDSRRDLTTAVNHMLRAFGLAELPLETVCQYIGEGARILVQRALGPTRQAQLDEGLAVFLTHYGAHLLDTTRPYDGIPQALAALTARGVVLSVLTNKPAVMSRTILDGLELLPCFAAVIGGDSLAVRKPDPAGIDCLLAATRTSRARTLLVGDSLIDVTTAHAAQVAFCGVAWGLRRADLVAARIERVIDHPQQLVRVVESGRV
jgi:phosphoglycolate phosphatase